MNHENKETVKIKRGCGNQSNSSSWTAAYNEERNIYVAMLSFGSAYGCWEALYEIPGETYEACGTFENDDYKTERLIRKGRLLYRYENERNYPEPMEIINDPDYESLRRMLVARES